MVEIWMIIVGSLAHELHAWTGENAIVGLLAPVNESVWEHFKLGSFAALTWIPFERWARRRPHTTPSFGVFVGLVALEASVVLIFFGVRPWIPDTLHLASDIGSYVVGSIAMGQCVRRLSDLESKGLEVWGRAGLLFVVILFGALTYYHPQWWLFMGRR